MVKRIYREAASELACQYDRRLLIEQEVWIAGEFEWQCTQGTGIRRCQSWGNRLNNR